MKKSITLVLTVMMLSLTACGTKTSGESFCQNCGAALR